MAAASAAPAAAAVEVHAFEVPSSIGNETTEAVLTPGFEGHEWFIVRGAGGEKLVQATNAGALTALPASLGSGTYLGLVNGPAGLVWALGEKELYAINSGGTATAVASSFEPGSMTVGPEGDLYSAQNAGSIDRYTVTAAPTATLKEIAVPPRTCGETNPQPDGIASASGQLWWSNDSDDLCAMKTSESFEGPFETKGVEDYVNHYIHALAAGTEGTLWAADEGELEKIEVPSGQVLAKYATGAPAGTKINAIATRANGEVWFTESGANAIGQLEAGASTIINHPLPSGYELTSSFATAIATGAENTVWFTAQTTAGKAAVGEVGGLPEEGSGKGENKTSTETKTSTTTPPAEPAPATLTIAASASVNAKALAAVKLTCSGAAGTLCKGTLTLTAREKTKVKRRSKGHTKTVTVSQTVTLGSGVYLLAAGEQGTISVELSASAVKAIDAASGRRLSATATAKPSSGGSATRAITLIGAKPVAHRRK